MKKEDFLIKLRSNFKDDVTEVERQKMELVFGEAYDGILSAVRAAKAEDAEAHKRAVDTAVADQLKKVVGEVGENDNVTAQIRALAEKVSKMQRGEEKPANFFAALRSAFEEHKDAIAATRNGGKVKIQLRGTAGVMTMANFATTKTLGYNESGVDSPVTLPEFLPSTLINRVNLGVGSNPMRWMERVKKDGTPAYFVEGQSGTKSLIDWNWSEKEVTAKVIAAMAVISKVAALNYATLEAEVKGELMAELENEFNDAILNGTGNANGQIEGVYAVYATEFDTTGQSVQSANYWDVLAKVWHQSRKKVRGLRPNAILVGLGIIEELDLQKTPDGQYLFPTWMLNADKTLKGARIVECDYIPEKAVLCGSFSEVLFNMVQDMEIEIGWMNDQFGKNQYSMLAEFMGMQRVKAHRNNFIKVADIDATTDAITKNPVIA